VEGRIMVKLRKVAKILINHKIEVVTFTIIFAGLLICNLPNLTWINTDSDGAHYLLSSKYMYPAHNTSAPLFLLIGRVFLFIPLGTEAWRLGLISVLATTACSVFIYLVVRRLLPDNKNVRWYAVIASVIYGGSALVISQSTIIETYALSTLLMVMAYYFSLKRQWIGVAITCGLLWAVHTLFALIIWIVLLVRHKQLRDITLIGITLSGFLFYLYIPIVSIFNNPPDMWGNASFTGFITNNVGTMTMLTGGLSIWDLPKRVLDTIGIIVVSLGFGFVINIWYFIKMRKWKFGLLWLFLIPIVYFIVNLSAETYVYMLPSVAFGAIVAGIGLAKLHISWSYITAVTAVSLLIFNVTYLDIGRTLDPNLSATKYYREELPKLKDGDILLAGGWTWAITYLYNKENNVNIIPVCTDILPSAKYIDKIKAQGVLINPTNSKVHLDLQLENALSVATLNDNVWLVKETNSETYEYEIVPAKDNLDLITRWLDYEVPATFRWKPSNPYLFITGGLEVTEWKFVLKSNHNCLFLAFGIGFIILIFRKKKVNAQSNA
jgi:hypothetical protein